MAAKAFPGLQTTRLVLRRLQESDWRMISYLRSDPTVNEFVKRSAAANKEEALAFITKIQQGFEKQSFYYWVITEKNHPEMIGSICFWNFSEDRKRAEVGYDLSPAFQGKGMMTEALKRVLAFGFENLSLEGIAAYTHRENQRSKQLLERNGFNLVEGKVDVGNKDNVIFEIKIK